MSSWPKEIARFAEDLRRATGIDPELTYSDERNAQLRVANERVETTADFTRTHAGRWKWRSSALYVDGQQRQIEEDAERLERRFRNPDDKPETTPEPLPQDRPVTDAPGLVQHTHANLRGVLGHARVGLADDGITWVVGVESDRGQLRVTFTRDGRDRKYQQVITLIVDGIDRSPEVADSLEQAAALLAGTGHTPTASTDDTAGAAAPARSTRQNSVEQRRMVVRRI